MTKINTETNTVSMINNDIAHRETQYTKKTIISVYVH